MAQPSSLKELVSSRAQASAGFSIDGGRAVVPYIVSSDDLDDAITFFLGDAQKGEDGRIKRSLPAAHPRWPALFCSNIQDIRGLMSRADGVSGFTLTAAESDLEAAAVTQYAQYPLYVLTCEFTPRSYAVLADDSIEVLTQSWTDTSGSAATATRVATEHLRFTDFEMNPQPDTATAMQGTMQFSTSSGDPDGKTFPGRPRILVPNGSFVVRWFQVPYSYIFSANSYLSKYVGYVNQLEFYEWPAGQLLYEGVRVVKRYPPVLPDLVGVYSPGTYELFKLCDLELSFRYADRIATNPPTTANANWVTDGHNCAPWFGDRSSGKYWYVATKHATSTKRVPPFQSFNMGLLFTDPDV